jgi:hypothetical protein
MRLFLLRVQQAQVSRSGIWMAIIYQHRVTSLGSSTKDELQALQA